MPSTAALPVASPAPELRLLDREYPAPGGAVPGHEQAESGGHQGTVGDNRVEVSGRFAATGPGT
jgi:hypothetical protein